METDMHYLSCKWSHYNNGKLSDHQMHFLINMIANRYNKHFLDILILLNL